MVFHTDMLGNGGVYDKWQSRDWKSTCDSTCVWVLEFKQFPFFPLTRECNTISTSYTYISQASLNDKTGYIWNGKPFEYTGFMYKHLHSIRKLLMLLLIQL